MKFEMRGYMTDYQNILKIYISNSRVQKYIKHVLNIFFRAKFSTKMMWKFLTNKILEVMPICAMQCRAVALRQPYHTVRQPYKALATSFTKLMNSGWGCNSVLDFFVFSRPKKIAR